MAFQVATARSGVTRLTASYWNSYVRDPLLYLHGDTGPIDLVDTLRLPSGGFFFGNPQVTTAQRTSWAGATLIKGAQVYDTDLDALMVWDGSAWQDATAGGTTQLLENGTTAESDNYKQLAPDGSGGVEWVLQDARVFEWDTPGTYTFNIPQNYMWHGIQTLGGGGEGGPGFVSTGEDATVTNRTGNGGGGGTRGQFAERFQYGIYRTPLTIRIVVGSGGATSGSQLTGAIGKNGFPSYIGYINPANSAANWKTVALGNGGNGGYAAATSQGGFARSLQYSRGSRGHRIGESRTSWPQAQDGGGGGGGASGSMGTTWETSDGFPGAVSRYALGTETNATGTGGLGGTPGTDKSDSSGHNGHPGTSLAGELGGKGGSGGGGGALASSASINGNGGNGGDGNRGGGGGGGGGSPLNGFHGQGGAGGHGVVRIMFWGRVD